MTRNQLIETMARAICDHDYDGNSAPFTGDIMWGDERIRIAYIARATAALAAIEAAGMRVVPVAFIAATDAMRRGIREAGVKRDPHLYMHVMAFDAARAMLNAAQEDSTSE